MSCSANSNIPVLGGPNEVRWRRVYQSLRMGAGHKSLFQPTTRHNKATPKPAYWVPSPLKGHGTQRYGSCLEKMEERRETKYHVFSMAVPASGVLEKLA